MKADPKHDHDDVALLIYQPVSFHSTCPLLGLLWEYKEWVVYGAGFFVRSHQNRGEMARIW